MQTLNLQLLGVAAFCAGLLTLPMHVGFDCYSLPTPCINTPGCMSYEVYFRPESFDPNKERCMPTVRVLVHNGSGRLKCTDAPPWIRRTAKTRCPTPEWLLWFSERAR